MYLSGYSTSGDTQTAKIMRGVVDASGAPTWSPVATTEPFEQRRATRGTITGSIRTSCAMAGTHEATDVCQRKRQRLQLIGFKSRSAQQ